MAETNAPQSSSVADIKEKVRPGLTGVVESVVSDKNTAIALGSGVVPVYATPAMAALMEEASVKALEGALPDDQTSVGVYLDIQHLAATPIGIPVRAEARLTAVEGRRLTFRVVAFDETEQIGMGTHQRVVVTTDRFIDRTQAKRQRK
jgi:predicted thioesterase